MSGHRLQAEADAAMDRYASTCASGGTDDERASAWARARAAFDKFMDHEHAQLKARSERDTVSVPTIPFPGRSV